MISTNSDIYTVSQLSQQVKHLLEDCFPEIWVQGELSNVSKPISGHCYFSLKDEHAQVRCALFRGRKQLLGYEPTDGKYVLVRARVSLYEARGDFQLVIQHIEDAGEGALRRAFEALKQELEKQGLFDPAHKKTLPVIPTRVGVVTSSSGAALHDIIITFQRRCPAIPLLVYPTTVQGNTAAEEIAAAIRLAGARQECDVLILARGGGSLEDLWPFNEKSVARAIYECPIPIVPGVGHETDITIADFVADRRAATPTAAAELVSPDALVLRKTVSGLAQQLTRHSQRRLEQLIQHTDWLAKRVVHPQFKLTSTAQRLHALQAQLSGTINDQLHRRQRRLVQTGARLMQRNPSTRLQIAQGARDALTTRLVHAARLFLERNQHGLSVVTGRMHNVSPLATLDRGYALVTDPDSGRLIVAARQVKPRDLVQVRLARGQLKCIVDKSYES